MIPMSVVQPLVELLWKLLVLAGVCYLVWGMRKLRSASPPSVESRVESLPSRKQYGTRGQHWRQPLENKLPLEPWSALPKYEPRYNEWYSGEEEDIVEHGSYR